MNAVLSIIDSLERTPLILQQLLDHIPRELFAVRRVGEKWTIHEQVCHLVDAQSILTGRFDQFENEENPIIRSYVPPPGRSSDHYLNMDLESALAQFPIVRAEMVQMLREKDEGFWLKQGRHEAFTPYNSKLLLTHTLNVDYAHLFSIEQLGLTKEGRENEIITIP